MTADPQNTWLEANEPSSLARWPCPLDQTIRYGTLVNFDGASVVTADRGLWPISRLDPFTRCLVQLPNGQHDWIRWDVYQRHAGEFARPADSGGADAATGPDGVQRLGS
jgi:hypothetical protein